MTKKKRRSVNVKEQAVMRLFRGEDMELVSRETGCTMHDLKQWRDKYKLAGKEGLKSSPRDMRDTQLEQRDTLIEWRNQKGMRSHIDQLLSKHAEPVVNLIPNVLELATLLAKAPSFNGIGIRQIKGKGNHIFITESLAKALNCETH